MERDELRADCARCVGLCCVATGFDRSADFACSKPAGVPCPHLRADHRCGIHPDRERLGFGGCAAYECWGAGPYVTRAVLGGRDWREHPDPERLFAAFRVAEEVHRLLAGLALARSIADSPALEDAAERVRALRDGAPTHGAVERERRVVDALLAGLRAAGALRRRAPSYTPRVRTLDQLLDAEQMQRLVTRFYDAVYADAELGPLFANVGRARQELRLAGFLRMTARPGSEPFHGPYLRDAHATVPVTEALFERRRALFEAAIVACGHGPEVVEAFREHDERWRAWVFPATGAAVGSTAGASGG